MCSKNCNNVAEMFYKKFNEENETCFDISELRIMQEAYYLAVIQINWCYILVVL